MRSPASPGSRPSPGRCSGRSCTEADIAGSGWRPIFLVNIPVGLLALAAAVRFIPESHAERRPDLDPVGVLVLGGGLMAVLYPLTMGREEGWPAWVFAMMAVGVAVLVAFGRRQYRTERQGGEPLVVAGPLPQPRLRRRLAGADGAVRLDVGVLPGPDDLVPGRARLVGAQGRPGRACRSRSRRRCAPAWASRCWRPGSGAACSSSARWCWPPARWSPRRRSTWPTRRRRGGSGCPPSSSPAPGSG